MVTGTKQEDLRKQSAPNYNNVRWDAKSGTFKVTDKSLGVSMPIDSEGPRARWRTIGIMWHLLRLKYPGRTVLRTASVDIMHRHTEYRMGPEVWGITSMGTDGKPIVFSSFDHALQYDFAI